jgi:plasmid stabilization system protein ParE
MSRKTVSVSIRTAARDDILRQYSYLLEEGKTPGVAERFLNRVEAAITRLSKTPEIGAPKKLRNPNLLGLRSWGISGFPAMRIYYLYDGATLRVLRVLHGKRDVLSLLEEGGEE